MPVDSQYYQAEHEAVGDAVQRDAEGHWRRGVSGNPAGRPLGSRNRATLMAQEILDVAAAILTHKIFERAMSGDSVALRFCLARILAPRRTSPAPLDLPPLETQQDLALAMAAIGSAVAAGEVTPGEAVEFARVVETAMQTIEAREAEYRTNLMHRRDRSPAAPRRPQGSPGAGDTAPVSPALGPSRP